MTTNRKSETDTVRCLLQSPDGICRRAELSRDQIGARIGPAEPPIAGWGRSLDGPASRYKTTSRDEAIIPDRYAV